MFQRLAILGLVLLTGAGAHSAAEAQSGLQITPDQHRILVSKDVGAECCGGGAGYCPPGSHCEPDGCSTDGGGPTGAGFLGGPPARGDSAPGGTTAAPTLR